MKIHRIIYLFSLIILLSNCRKDWGVTEESYNSALSGPDTLNTSFSYRTVFDINPESMEMGSEVNISVNIFRTDEKAIGFPVYFNWSVGNNQRYFCYGYRGWFYFEIFEPRINNLPSIEGFNINKVRVTTSVDQALAYFSNSQMLSDELERIGDLLIVLRLGYENEKNEIKYFYSKYVNIPMYY